MADVDIRAVRDEWVGRVFQEIDLVVDRERMLEWAIACGETDPRFIDPDHPDFQASTAFPTHVNAARMLPDNFPQFGSGRGIDGGKSIEWHRPMRPGGLRWSNMCPPLREPVELGGDAVAGLRRTWRGCFAAQVPRILPCPDMWPQ